MALKIILDPENADYLEVKKDLFDQFNFSIRAKTGPKDSVLITAKLDSLQLEKLITELVILKSKV